MRIAIAVALPQELDGALLKGAAQVVYTGVGKVNAALAVGQALQNLKPDILINFGTAGAIHPGLFGLLPVSRVVQRDMNAEPLAPRGTTPFHSGPQQLDSGQPGWVCGTGDSFVSAHDPWFDTAGIHLVDMELFAIASACQRMNVAWRSMKFISDQANGDSPADWQANVRRGEQLFVRWFCDEFLVQLSAIPQTVAPT